MKNLPFPLVLLLGVTLLATSCKDDDEASSVNTFEINGSTGTLSKAFVTFYDTNNDGSYDWDVILSTDSGEESTLIDLDLNTTSAQGLVSGTYNWSDDREAFTIVGGGIIIDFNINDATQSYLGTSTDGTVVINVGDNDTEFNVNLTMEDGEVLTAYYKGELTPF